MNINISFDPRFDALMKHLKDIAEDCLRIEGIHPDQLDIDKVARSYFKKGHDLEDMTIDPNANVAEKTVITFNYEVPKSFMKLNSLYNLWLLILSDHGEGMANSTITSAVLGSLYINDCWDVGRPYCFNFSTRHIAKNGLKMGGKLVVDPPKSLHSFLHQVEQFVVYAANSTLGATGLADLLVVCGDFIHNIRVTGIDGHMYVHSHAKYIKELLISFIYTLNWQFRGHQSPFTNVSVYDDHFLDTLLSSEYPEKSEDNESLKGTIKQLQEIFLDAMNEVMSRTPLTFPVVTACFSVDASGTGKRVIKDEKFLEMIAEKNSKFGFINFYMGEVHTLSSCCRLRSSVSDLGYMNTLGAGNTEIGSVGVVTVNLYRLFLLAERDEEKFLKDLIGAVYAAAVINNAKRQFIADRIERGALPLYDLGFMSLDKQFSTCGFTGLYEVSAALSSDGSFKLCIARAVLNVMNEALNRCATVFGTPHNLEQVPGESLCAKLAEKDRLLFGDAAGVPDLYANQFIPLFTGGYSVATRLDIQGILDPLCSGGSICHIQIGDDSLKKETIQRITRMACGLGVVYFALNLTIRRCGNGHMTVGKDSGSCPFCGSADMEEFSRVVGFITSTKNWNRTRREKDWKRRGHFCVL